MTVKELIRQLKTFEETHYVEIEVDFDCACRKIKTGIKDVQFKDGNCVLYGENA